MGSKERGSTEKNKGEEEGSGPLASVGRPSRERKLAKRFLSTPSSANPEPADRNDLSLGQGSGTKLKDIPRVYLKLEKYKIDENLQVLHTILYGNRTKAYNLKSEILEFSGFVWGENEPKLRARVKKMLDKCNKEILLDFCEILDIEYVKTSTEKEIISAMLMEFLESPYVTTDDIPAIKKAKWRTKVKKMLDKCNKEILHDFCEILEIEPGKASTKKEEISARLIKILESSPGITTDVVPAAKRRRKSEKNFALDEDEIEDRVDCDDPSEPSNYHKYVTSSESEHDQSEEEQEENDEWERTETFRGLKGKQTEIARSSNIKKNVSPAKSVCRVYSRRGSSISTSKEVVVVEDEPSRPEVGKSFKDLGNASGMKDRMISSSSMKSNLSEKQLTESQGYNKEQAKNLSDGPSASDMRVAIVHIVEQVGIESITFGNLRRRLEEHFNVDLTDRNTEVKQLAMDVVLSMYCDEDEGSTDDDDEEDVETDDVDSED